MSNDSAPCEVEARIWRDCLKEHGYGPDRLRGTCDAGRFNYYNCIKVWSAKQGTPYDSKNFQLKPECGPAALAFHNCMMIGMFETSRCRKESFEMKKCGAKHDPEIFAALQEDFEVMDALKNEDALMKAGPLGKLGHLWDKLIGKA